MKALLFAGLITLAALSGAIADDGSDAEGYVNPDENNFLRLREELRQRPERAGFLCWAVYEVQKGGSPYHDMALDALKECVAVGNAPSMILLAHAYENGLGTEKSPELSTYWVRKAAEKGYAIGQYHYGVALVRGFGTKADIDAGRDWLTKAAENGNEDAVQFLKDLGPGM